jgi:hypothetical protein
MLREQGNIPLHKSREIDVWVGTVASTVAVSQSKTSMNHDSSSSRGKEISLGRVSARRRFKLTGKD